MSTRNEIFALDGKKNRVTGYGLSNRPDRGSLPRSFWWPPYGAEVRLDYPAILQKRETLDLADWKM